MIVGDIELHTVLILGPGSSGLAIISIVSHLLQLSPGHSGVWLTLQQLFLSMVSIQLSLLKLRTINIVLGSLMWQLEVLPFLLPSPVSLHWHPNQL